MKFEQKEINLSQECNLTNILNKELKIYIEYDIEFVDDIEIKNKKGYKTFVSNLVNKEYKNLIILYWLSLMFLILTCSLINYFVVFKFLLISNTNSFGFTWQQWVWSILSVIVLTIIWDIKFWQKIKSKIITKNKIKLLNHFMQNHIKWLDKEGKEIDIDIDIDIDVVTNEKK